MAPRLLPNNNYAYYSQDAITIILSTETYKIDKDFKTNSDTCLIYAETIEVASDVSLPGKNLGLFCQQFLVPKSIKIDVSGTVGTAGSNSMDQDGGNGGNGGNSGHVWIFVQHLDLNKDDHVFKRLTINAEGGAGGAGGSANSDGKTGGKGGNGGNGGDIEILFGLPAMEAILALATISKRSWPEQVSNLLDGQLCANLPSYVSNENKETLKVMSLLIGALKTISSQAELLSLHGSSDEIRKTALSIVQGVTQNLTSVEAPTGITAAIIDHITKLGDSIRAVNNEVSGRDVMKILEEAKDVFHKQLPPSKDSDLRSLIDSIDDELEAYLSAVKKSIQSVTKQNSAGPYGIGGNSIHAAKPGVRGEDGKIQGKSKVQALRLNGNKADLDVLQAYIFPEQCQMLLNKADDLFFATDPDSWSKASEIYNHLLVRLEVLHAIPATKQQQLYGLEKAWEHLEIDMKITNNPVSQLRSVYEQAKTRRNRLLLNQDMFGHVDNWVPRLSCSFYAQSVEKRFGVLEAAEKLTQDYENAFLTSSDVKTEVSKGIESMGAAEAEAKAKIDLLTAQNGPLLTGIYKIIELSADMKTKRAEIKEKISKVTFNYKLDPQLILDGFATLAETEMNAKSVVKIVQKGYDAYKSTTTVQDLKGDTYKKDYIIDQLEQCDDKLESLDKALKSSKNAQIPLDDPGALKVLASSKDIKQLVHSFKSAIPESQVKAINEALDQYLDITLRRNSTVLDYNSSIQLLLEATSTQQYCKSQADRLGERKLLLDPNIPAIVFWLRKTRDNMRLELMQRLNYESRAIRYWGLRRNLNLSQPGPLRNVLQLRQSQQELDEAFEQSLSNYANNIRVTWPRDESQKGLLYHLASDQLTTLKTPRTSTNPNVKGSSYTVSIKLDPGNAPFGSGRADVRITQVRLWLAGVSVGEDESHRRPLRVEITHTGDEAFEDSSHTPFHFTHDMVKVQFAYDTAKAQVLDDFNTKAVFIKQGIESNWSGGDEKPKASTFAAIGPFTEWRFVIKEAENPSLDMTKVTDAYIEFSGANRPFSTSRK